MPQSQLGTRAYEKRTLFDVRCAAGRPRDELGIASDDWLVPHSIDQWCKLVQGSEEQLTRSTVSKLMVCAGQDPTRTLRLLILMATTDTAAPVKDHGEAEGVVEV
jgi:hypothetical protein